MLKLYAFSTPNSVRVPIALEELGLDYEIEAINVRKGEQRSASYLEINPNGKVPVLVDPDGPQGEPFILTESGAILIYLADKTGKLVPGDQFGRARVMEQMFFHLSGIGPAFGQVGFFKRQAPEELPLAIDRFQTEAARVLGVFDGMLATSEFAAGNIFTIADITHFYWMWRCEFAGLTFDGFPNIARWYDQISSRPAVVRAIERVTALAPAA